MKKVTAASIVRELACGSSVFNDRLDHDGGRSIKVEGWTETDYDKANKQINEAGCGYSIVHHYLSRSRYSYGKQVCRLWVFNV